MLKKLLLIIFVLILCSSLASAVAPDDEDLIVHYELDESGNQFVSETGVCGMTYNGLVQQQDPLISWSTKSLGFNGNGDYLINSSAACYSALGSVSITKGYTILFVGNFGDTGSWQYIFDTKDGGGYVVRYDDLGINSLGFSSYDGGHNDCDFGYNPDGKNHLFVAVNVNSSHATLFANATQVGQCTDTFAHNPVDYFVIGGLVAIAAYSFNDDLDEIMLFNRTLTLAELSDIHTNGLAVELGVPATPTYQAPTPADNADNNTNVTINCTTTDSTTNLRFFLNVSLTGGGTDMPYLFNTTVTGEGHKTFLTNFSDGIYSYDCFVQNITNGLFSNEVTRTMTIDTVNPTITRLTNNNWKINNLTILNPYTHNLTLNISFFDINLYQTLINITNETGDSAFNHTNTSVTGTTDNMSQVIDISGWSLGNYTIKLSAVDSHTADEILTYDVRNGLDYFRYTTGEGNIIKIKSDTLPLTKQTTKLKDRYDFEFNYLFQKDTYKFIIESYNKIDYIEDSKYNAHFVIIGKDGKGNWIDFNNPNLNSKDYVITKIDDYTYEVEITANGIKSFTFNSIGGLNSVETHYKIRLGAVIDVWVYDEENYPKQINTTATIDTQSANSSINVSGARLVNITKDITSLSLTSTGFGTEEKAISITDSYHNLSFNMSPVSAAKLYFYDENSGALIAGETFSVYLETTGFSQIYSGITDNPHSITGLGSGLYKLKASSANYPERQYLDLNISNVTTTNLNIYLINDTLGSEITFNIVDEGLNPLDEVSVVFTKIINGTGTVIAEEESDFAGQVIVTLDENIQYTINFSKANYEDQTITLEPKNSEYVIKMISTIGKYNQSVYEGIRYRFEPSNIVLNNNTKYNFSFTLNSSTWPVTNCTLKLYNDTILLNETSSYTPNSCFISIERGTSDMTTIVSEAIYELNSEYEFTVSQQYSVIYTYEGDFSLKNFLDDLSDFGMAGFDDFGRMMLALIVIFIITALAAQKIGFTNPEVLIFLVIVQVWFFSYVNWLYLDFTPIPTIAGFDLKKYIIAILITLAGGAFAMRKFTD